MLAARGHWVNSSWGMKGQDFPGLALSLGVEEESEKRKQGPVGSEGCLG